MSWVAKVDYRLDNAGKHTLSLRGTLGDNTIDQILAEFPGQAPASIERDNNKGLSARYTAVLTPTIVNTFTYGFTSLDENLSGVSGTGFQFEPTALAPLQNWGARARGRTNPLNNVLDDVNWTKGKHTITMGLNFRYNRNNTSTFTNAYPLYAYGATELIGLGEDIDNSVQSYLGGKLGNPNLQLANPTAVTNAVSHAVGCIERRFCDLSIHQGRASVAARDAAAALVHRAYLRGLHWRRLSRKPRTYHQLRIALRKLPAAL